MPFCHTNSKNKSSGGVRYLHDNTLPTSTVQFLEVVFAKNNLKKHFWMSNYQLSFKFDFECQKSMSHQLARTALVTVFLVLKYQM